MQSQELLRMGDFERQVRQRLAAAGIRSFTPVERRVSQALGLSYATVYRALRGERDRPDVRDEINRVLKEMGA